MKRTKASVKRRYTRADWTDFAHTGPGTLAGRYLRMFWQPVYCSQNLPRSRPVPIRIMSEDFTLYRGESGTPHVIGFRCAHRGTQLSTGWVEGDSIRCLYHGWKYDASGQCIEQPAEADPFCQKIKIESYPTEEYLGLIFVYFGEGKAPPLPRHPEFEGEDALCEGTASEIYPCNTFNRIDNAMDMTHVTFAHFQLRYQPDVGFQPPTVEACETEYGAVIRGNYPDGPAVQHYFMPNFNWFQLGTRNPAETRSRDRLSWKVPLDDSHSVNFHATRIYLTGEAADGYRSRRARADADGRGSREHARELAEAILAGHLRVQDLANRPNAVELEDLTTMVGQGVIADREHEHLGRSDVGVILIRKLWERELRALAQGRPLKRWTRPKRLEATWYPHPEQTSP